jgi:DNA-binding response OmpR family regulator
MPKIILIVSDKLAIYEPISLNAGEAGCKPAVVGDYEEAIRMVSSIQPSILILDSNIAGVSAGSLITRLRLSRYTNYLPVIVVTSVDYENEHLPMFEAGADDVVDIAFSVREFFARVKAVTRPRPLKASVSSISLGAVTLEPEGRRVLVRNAGKEVEVTMRPTTFDILRLLSTRAGLVLTREEIFNSVWGASASVGMRNVDVQIAFLRSALRDSHCGLQIDAVPGRGYRLAVHA